MADVRLNKKDSLFLPPPVARTYSQSSSRFSDSGSGNTPPSEQKAQQRPPFVFDTRKALWLIAAILGFFVVWEVVLQVCIMPGLRIHRIEILGNSGMDERSFLELTGLENNPTWFQADPERLEAILSEIPSIKSAKVDRQFPDVLHVTLTSRKALVQAVLKDENTVALLDEDGVAFARAPDGLAYDVPILSGLEFRGFTPGTRLPSYIVPFLHDLGRLQEQSPSLFQAFSEFRLVPRGDQDMEVLVYAVEHGVPVRINPRIDTESATYILRVLRMVGETKGYSHVQELDFRAKDVIVKKGEQ